MQKRQTRSTFSGSNSHRDLQFEKQAPDLRNQTKFEQLWSHLWVSKQDGVGKVADSYAIHSYLLFTKAKLKARV